MRDIYGRMSQTPYAYYDRESQCLKTCQDTFLSEWRTFSATLPKSGMMRDGQLFEPLTPALPTDASAFSSLLPTPVASDSNGIGQHGSGGADLRTTVAVNHDLGPYRAACDRWAPIVGRPAPNPVAETAAGSRLSPAFVEWMMGLPAGHVTGHGLSRNACLRMLGNGVVPQQAALALSLLDPC